jgi:hypothetical protein
MNARQWTLTVLLLLSCRDSFSSENGRPIDRLVAASDRLNGSKSLETVSPDARPLLRSLSDGVRLVRPLSTPTIQDVDRLHMTASRLEQIDAKAPSVRDVETIRLVAADLHVMALRVDWPDPSDGPFVKSPNEPFHRLKGALRDALDRTPEVEPLDRRAVVLLKSAERDVEFLTDIAFEQFNAKGHDEFMPDEYFVDLDFDGRLLGVTRTNAPPVVKSEAIHASTDDLHSKAESARQSLVKPFGPVKTIVTTRDQSTNRPKGECEVWYVAMGRANKPDVFRRFREFSSPAEENRMPGRYSMWTRFKRRETPHVDFIKVEDDGHGRCKVDLWAP